jgi:hypothetical protein
MKASECIDMRERDARPDDINRFARSLCDFYRELCNRFLPVAEKGSAWRFSREPESGDPEQGWKLHVSANVLTANEVLEKVGPFLHSRGVLFKAPGSLQELDRINCGVFYGYSQVGKFITVYPRSDDEAISLARRLQKLTLGISAPVIPFDTRYREGSCVYYRYGAFSPLNIEHPDGLLSPAIRDLEGNLVPDLRESSEKLAWVVDPFVDKRPARKKMISDSPLKTTFRAFRALSQRGKGGVYQAIDLSATPPRLCILKEGRPGGEVSWDGRDGRWRVRNEEMALGRLQSSGIAVPRIYSSFEAEGHYYLVTEFIGGDSLQALLRKRRRRLSIAQALRLGIKLSLLISQVHAAGWVWRDCKPANLIVTKRGELRPLDFEGACPIDRPDPFIWSTPDFTPPECEEDDPGQSRAPEDLYALGLIIYFLITARLPQPYCPVPMQKLRRGVPEPVCVVVSELLARDPKVRPDAATVALRLGSIWPGAINSKYWRNVPGRRTSSRRECCRTKDRS